MQAPAIKKFIFSQSHFFLRGDDIEMGMHLQENNIPCQVNGWLVVFQEPKHSLWHELWPFSMAHV